MLASEAQKILNEVLRRAPRSSSPVEEPEPPQCRKEMRRVAQFQRQRTCPPVSVSCFGRAPSLSRHDDRPPSDLELKLTSGSLRTRRLTRKQRERAIEVRLGFPIGSSAPRVLCGALKIDSDPAQLAAALEVHRQFRGQLRPPLPVRPLHANAHL